MNIYGLEFGCEVVKVSFDSFEDGLGIAYQIHFVYSYNEMSDS